MSSPLTTMSISTIITLLCILNFIAHHPSTPVINEELLQPLVQQIQAAVAAHDAGQPEAALENLRAAFTLFKSKFGDGHRETFSTLLSPHIDYNDSDSILAALLNSETPSNSKSTKLGQLMYETAKEVFGPTHVYSLTILQSMAVSLFIQGKTDQSLQLHVALTQILRGQLNSTSKSTDAETLLLGTLDTLSTLYINADRNLTEASAIYREMYNLQKNRLGPSAPDTEEALQRLADLNVIILFKEVMALFQLVQENFNIPPDKMTYDDKTKVIEAYDFANKLTPTGPKETFSTYMQLLTMLTRPGKSGRLQWGMKTAGAVTLQYEEDVYELMFIIQRLLYSSADLREKGPEWGAYRKKLADGGDSSNSDAATADFTDNYAEALERSVAKSQKEQDDALQRANDLIERTRTKFGKASERTKGVAEILGSLYAKVGMDKEAQEIGTRFALLPKKQEGPAVTRTKIEL